MIHTEVTPAEQADRLAIRALVDAYAHCADRRLGEEQKLLFTEDAHFVVYMDGQGTEPSQILDDREALTPVFEDLNRYQATQHFNGQSTIELDGNRATGESYCIAHHRSPRTANADSCSRTFATATRSSSSTGAWLFAERNRYVDWIETKPSYP
jgi:hypothetical protein